MRSSIILAFAAVYIIWGSTYLAIKVMVESIPPLWGASIRFCIAGVLMFAYLVSTRGLSSFKMTSKEALKIFLTSILLVVAGPGLTTVAEKYISSSLAAIVIASVPLWIILWRLFARETIGAVTMVACLLGLLGVAIVVLGSAPEETNNFHLLGIGLVLLVAIFYSIGSFLVSKGGLPSNSFTVSASQMLIAGVLLGSIAISIEGEPGVSDWSSSSLWALLYLTIPGSVIAFSAYVWLLKNVAVSQVSTYAFVNPIVALALGWIFLGEELSVVSTIGAFVTISSVAGIVMINKNKS